MVVASYVTSAKKRDAFREALTKGQGLSSADRAFVRESSKNPGRRLLLVMLISFVIVTAAALGMYLGGFPKEKRDLVYQIFMGTVTLGVALGSIFIVSLAVEFTSRRIDRANRVADCVANHGEDIEDCARIVANDE